MNEKELVELEWLGAKLRAAADSLTRASALLRGSRDLERAEHRLTQLANVVPTVEPNVVGTAPAAAPTISSVREVTLGALRDLRPQVMPDVEHKVVLARQPNVVPVPKVMPDVEHKVVLARQPNVVPVRADVEPNVVPTTRRQAMLGLGRPPNLVLAAQPSPRAAIARPSSSVPNVRMERAVFDDGDNGVVVLGDRASGRHEGREEEVPF